LHCERLDGEAAASEALAASLPRRRHQGQLLLRLLRSGLLCQLRRSLVGLLHCKGTQWQLPMLRCLWLIGFCSCLLGQLLHRKLKAGLLLLLLRRWLRRWLLLLLRWLTLLKTAGLRLQ